jgi:hypothetical protein
VVEEERKVGDKKAVRERIQNKVRFTNTFFQFLKLFIYLAGELFSSP